MKTTAAVLVRNEELISGVNLMEFDAPTISSVAEPGQFVMVRCNESTVIPRPFSIHNSNREAGRLSLLVAVKGRGTRWLARRRPEEKASITGPLGNCFTLPEKPSRLLLVGGGIGIAPLVYLAFIASVRHDVTMLVGAASASKLYPTGLLPHSVTTVNVTEDGSEGRRGRVSDALPDYIGWAEYVYACGPTPMYRSLNEKLEASRKEIATEVSLEVRMGCGSGICYGCTVRTLHGMKQVCRDGPIFNIRDIVWESVVC